MQDEFTDIIYENFPIRETAARISRTEKESEDVFDTKEITMKKKGISTKHSTSKPQKQEKE